MCKRLFETINKHTIIVPTPVRITIAIFISILVLFIVLSSALHSCGVLESSTPEDTNVYLNEQVCYAKEVNIKVVGISVTENSDGDSDIKYYLNLDVEFEPKTVRKLFKTRISPNSISLVAINQKAKGPWRLFFDKLAKKTIEVLASTAIDGSVNLISETVVFSAEYSATVLDEVATNKQLKPVHLQPDAFEPFSPGKERVTKTIAISFPISEEYLETDCILALSIDAFTRFEERIFLTVRPNSENQTNDLQ